MSYIQLIEKAVLPTSLWLTFWDLSEGSQLSLEIAAPTEIYDVGRVFSLDRDADFERLALRPVTDPSALAGLDLLIPMPAGSPPRGRTVAQKAVSIRETSEGGSRERDGWLTVVA